MSDITLLTALQLLITENTIVRSRFSTKQQQQLNSLAKQTGIITLSKQGRGFVYQLVNAIAVQHYLTQLQPLTESELTKDLPQRSRNIGLYKDSKQVNAKHTVYYLLLKAMGQSVYWYTDEKHIDISRQTELQGVSSLLIQVHDNWQSNCPLFLVENQALFNNIDWLPNYFNGSLIYYGGNIPTLLLNWLAYKIRGTELILFADYDGVGLSNFLKLCRAVGNKQSCHFYLMPRWQEKLHLFGKTAIWQDNQARFYNAVHGLNEIQALTNELQTLTSVMQSLGKGLEQEAVWL